MTTSTASDLDLAARLRLAVTRLARRLRQQAEHPGVSPTQIAALSTIERAGPMTLGALAAAEQVAPPTITAAVGKLEEQGLVRREIDAGDRRVVRVEATRAGRKLLASTRTRKNAYLDRRLRSLSPADRETLARAADILEGMLE